MRTAAELTNVDGLVLPGGESTAMLRLMASEGLVDRIRDRVSGGMPVLATCAGIILVATQVEPPQPSIECLDVGVRRNAFGRQVYSDVVDVDLAPELGPPPTVRGIFIRAPRITRVGPGVEVLATPRRRARAGSPGSDSRRDLPPGAHRRRSRPPVVRHGTGECP